MIIIKNFLIAFAMLVITTVHRGSAADTLCERILIEDDFFMEGKVNAVLNFQNGYKYLTTSQIDEKFKLLPGEAQEIMMRKTMYRKVTRGYFLDLIKRRNFPVDGMLTPTQWCKNRVDEGEELRTINPERKPDQYKICKDHIYGHLFKRITEVHPYLQVEGISLDSLFKFLYEEWTSKKLQDRINFLRSNSLELDVQIEADYIENYSLGYYEYFSKYYVDNRRHRRVGYFRSIDKFCQKEGYRFINENA